MMYLALVLFGLIPHQNVSDTLRSGDAHNYHLEGFADDASVIIRVTGNGKGDLDCYVIREKRVVSSDESNSDTCALQAKYTKGTILMVVNNGQATDKFTIVIGEYENIRSIDY